MLAYDLLGASASLDRCAGRGLQTWGSANPVVRTYQVGVRGGPLAKRHAIADDPTEVGTPAAGAALRRDGLGPCSLLSVAEVAAELGVDVDTALAWLKRQGLLREVPGLPGVQRVVAEDLVAAVRGEGTSARPTRRDRLRQLGPCNVLSVNDAIAELGMGSTEGKEWLEGKGLIHRPGRDRRGNGRVIVSELIEAIRGTHGRPGKRRVVQARVPLKLTDEF